MKTPSGSVEKRLLTWLRQSIRRSRLRYRDRKMGFDSGITVGRCCQSRQQDFIQHAGPDDQELAAWRKEVRGVGQIQDARRTKRAVRNAMPSRRSSTNRAVPSAGNQVKGAVGVYLRRKEGDLYARSVMQPAGKKARPSLIGTGIN